ncbi:MAG: hypothetical protein WCQ44_10150 [Opitutaceae bacterium]
MPEDEASFDVAGCLVRVRRRDQAAARAAAVDAVAKKYGIRSKGAAVARAQKDHPELWK